MTCPCDHLTRFIELEFAGLLVSFSHLVRVAVVSGYDQSTATGGERFGKSTNFTIHAFDRGDVASK